MGGEISKITTISGNVSNRLPNQPEQSRNIAGFKVSYRNGQTAILGGLQWQSRHPNYHRAAIYHIGYLVDQYGNRVNFSYRDDVSSDIKAINAIDYGQYTIQFHYALPSAATPTKYALGGLTTTIQQLLSSIEIKQNGAVWQRYTLNYDASQCNQVNKGCKFFSVSKCA